MDEELLAAFREEFLQLCADLAATSDEAGAQRALSQLRAMADGMEIAALQAQLRELEDADLDTLRIAAEPLAAIASRQAMPEPVPEPEPTPAIAPAAGERPIRTLIVDDSAMMRRMLRGILAGDPRFAVVGEAADGAAGLAAQAELRPDLTLLDLEMPVLDGMGFLAEWAVAGHGAVVVVSSAAHPGSAPALEALRRGAFAAVAKPSGALSPDIAQRAGADILATARQAAGA